MARKILLLIVFFVTTASSSLLALGLGEIKLKSGLNQPLDAEIVLVSVRGETNEQLRGKLGSGSQFERSGIERIYFLTKIRFETITKANGQKVLHLTTRDAVKEPFLNFLVDLDWPNGRLLREYTLLLDPPIFDDAPKTTITPVLRESRPTVEKKTTSYVAPRKRQDGHIYGPTSSSDTLWGIATKVRPDRSVSIQQAMITIYEANPEAFMRGNINNLKRGAEIRVPDEETFNQISQREAIRMIAVHNENWKSGRRNTPRVVIDTSLDNDYQTTTNQKASDSGRLSLSTDLSETGTGGSSASDLYSEEDNEVLKQQNESLQEKTRTDAEKIKQLERLLELKDEQLAMIQSRGAETSDTPPNTNTNSNSAVAEDVTKEQKVAEAPVVEATAKLADVTPAEPIKKQKPDSLIDGLMNGSYNLYLGIVGGVVLLFLTISVIRRKTQDVDYHDAVAASAPAARTSSLSNTADELPEIADDVLSGTDVMDFDETEVEKVEPSDPLGEADIYLAYGKFEQAEDLLLSALESNPERLELNIKLLECYAEIDEKDKFEAQVDTVAEAINSDTELSKFIEDLYLNAWPDGELYAADTEQDYAEDELNTAEEQSADYPDEQDSDDIEDLPSTDEVFGEDVVDNASTTEDADESSQQDDLEDADAQEDTDEDNDIDTQLDLARAYIDMGDIEGTREIIKEIMESGTEEQCEEAQKILDAIED